ncbi:MAG: hypothetical protein RBS39_09530 [Phycisphaerales bacterium]|jgi:hypothetical protein|nr:hypothetical protein [Phycisphaerales bacterium]
MPKCPACFAAYALLFTGIGLSFGAAAVLRWTLLSLSVGILVVLVVRTIRAHATRSRAHDQTREYASR